MEIEVGAVTRSGSTELVLLDNQDELGRQTVVLMETEVMAELPMNGCSAMKDLLMTKKIAPSPHP